jgi:NAD-dependent dihydropyrimidine dehydrogenase PreA subunit
MTYVIIAPCIDVKDGTCVDVCPVDCIYEGGRMFYIQPDECIACGLCETVCPVEAIYHQDDVPADMKAYTDINRRFFDTEISGLGSPGGASRVGPLEIDVPDILKLAS